ncbi:family 2A encapsulin nanocompartment cargo protein cysteine desulfurase [Streptomyces sp. WI04-05B]|uniref:family 2A encapsulin nanocompartment cargo protein cysteine desulfurase n=1 Tax=Streptomyces TaxID=1883 RepID=UPI0029AD5980|nr:family 2A encapsulin nanocompartment cargo protein cysteine desulfurase [Streptomyces sp. WI04-05A]MDX2589193.1 family 2A encapsulin nanocompartment cargo protein cysteine desulfurase [Streptomyces sp. WI04-05A]
MTTPPATGNEPAPAWLPDEETLNRLAGEFFRALPGQPAVPDGSAPGMRSSVPDVPSSGTHAPAPGGSSSGTQASARDGSSSGAGAPASGGSAPGMRSSVPDVPTSGTYAPARGGSSSGGQDPVREGSWAATPASVGDGSAAWPMPAGLPLADPPPPAPRAGMSPPAGPPPTSGPATYGASVPGVTGHTPELPTLPVVPGTSVSSLPPVPAFAPAQLSAPGSFYFLDEAPGFPAEAPELPGFGHLGLPPLADPAVPTTPTATTAPYYFVQEGGAPGVPGAPAAPVGLPLDQHPAFDVRAVRRDFPILSELVNGRPLIWLDNAATTQKPQVVIDRLVEFYSRENSNIHRAAHELAARATDAYEGARKTVARFVGAGSAEEIVFVRGTTEAINLVAKAWGPRHLRAGDEIVLSHLEHHANIVPWQMLAQQTGAVIKVIPVDDAGQLLLDEYTDLLSDRTRLVAVTQMSNALGTVVPVEQIIELGHRAGARVLVDAAQSVPHLPIDVRALDADFLVFSGHKLFGPTGIGVLYAKREVLEDMPPWEGGGNMITDVTFEKSSYQPPPGRFEAGTGNIADAVGLAAAIDYVERVGLANIGAYEHTLVEHATEGLRGVPGLRLIGTAPHKASIVSFVLDGYEPAEVGTALNEEGIAVRSGHHCAQPILRRYGLEATVRPSFAFYNTHEEVDTLVTAVHRLADRGGGRRR